MSAPRVSKPRVLTPENLRWSTEKYKRALDHHQYIHVGGKGQVSHRVITKANAVWSGVAAGKKAKGKPAEPNVIYCPNVRITGTPENVRAALIFANYLPQDAQWLVEQSYTRSNVGTFVVDPNDPTLSIIAQGGTMSAQFNEEVRNYMNYKASAPSKGKEKKGLYALTDIPLILSQLKDLKTVDKVSTRRTGNVKGIDARLKTAISNNRATGPDGKKSIVDVSDFLNPTDKKKPVKLAKAPIKGGRTLLRWYDLDNFPLASRNPAAYEAALRAYEAEIGQSPPQHATYLSNVKAQFTPNVPQNYNQTVGTQQGLPMARPGSPRAQQAGTPLVYTTGGVGPGNYGFGR